MQRHVNGGHFLSPSSHIDPGTSHVYQGTRARRHRSWAVAGCFLLRLLKLVISSGREKPAAVKDLTCRCQGFCSTADQSAWGALDQNPPVHGRPITTSHTTNLTRANDRIRNRRLHLHWVTINSDSCLPFATPLGNTAASAREDPCTPTQESTLIPTSLNPGPELTPMPRSLNIGSRDISCNYVLIPLPGQQERAGQITTLPRPQTFSIWRRIPPKS